MHELLVTMDFVEGREATVEDFISGSDVLMTACRAIVWLAVHMIIYVDLRDPNVLVNDEGEVFLIDYDDCIVVEKPVKTFEDFKAAVVGTIPKVEIETFSTFATALRDNIEAVQPIENALRTAFAEFEASSS